MAAVRGSAGSGVVVALVILAVLTCLGIGSGLFFYQQSRQSVQAIQTEQQAFANIVGRTFTANGWQLSRQTPSELGIEFTEESYTDVQVKLAVAAEYEKETLPFLDWESLEGMRSALARSPVQRVAEAEGEAPYHMMRPLLKSYEDSWTQLRSDVAGLQSRNADLAQRLDEAKKSQVETEQRLQRELTDATQKFEGDLTEQRTVNNDLQTRHDRQRQEAVDWRAKYQQEVNERKRDVTQIKDELAALQKLYDEVVRGPGEADKLVPEGKVIEVRTDYRFVLIQGGKDRGVSQSDRLIVYTVTPDGRGRKKGEILVGEVYEHTSLATIVVEERGEYVLEGDSFVSVARWDSFHREPETAQAVGVGSF